eukprot:CAMPEP_0175074026 /NCGR_PEP_ID=MMETSP0052_2-20121109/20991_1 /TAXON_ID=51329 ORGANISM="Polytomella parva, Strain SAG 63-3" /NCGR_SAMPLE_ID=MMETSP0052_2 /ASSEMBLY_ACC=CAM_ASM_000194 /LENGTH=253 /DNA_ID=CAMNT_0016342105 /DNA_START=29 /DNA_END=787 /DNA_ORIENTATION=+
MEAKKDSDLASTVEIQNPNPPPLLTSTFKAPDSSSVPPSSANTAPSPSAVLNADNSAALAFEEAFAGLSARKHLERERSLKRFEKLLLEAKLALKKQVFLQKLEEQKRAKALSHESLSGLAAPSTPSTLPESPVDPPSWPLAAVACQKVNDLLSEVRWEPRLGGLLAAQALCQSGLLPSSIARQWTHDLLKTAIRSLGDEEVRLRMGVGDVFFSLCRGVYSHLGTEARDEEREGEKEGGEEEGAEEEEEEEEE